jgi:hypothetical protein
VVVKGLPFNCALVRARMSFALATAFTGAGFEVVFDGCEDD